MTHQSLHVATSKADRDNPNLRDGGCPVASLARELARICRGRRLIHSHLPESGQRSSTLQAIVGDWSLYHVDSFLIERANSLEALIKTMAATSPFGAAVQLLLLCQAGPLGDLLMEELDAIPPNAKRLMERSEEHVRLMAWSAYQALVRMIDDPDLRTLEAKLGCHDENCLPIPETVAAILAAA